jgi:arylsulfatase A-like enzyme
LKSLEASVFDIAPTVLKLFGIEAPKQMQGRVLTEIFVDGSETKTASAPAEEHHHQ